MSDVYTMFYRKWTIIVLQVYIISKMAHIMFYDFFQMTLFCFKNVKLGPVTRHVVRV